VISGVATFYAYGVHKTYKEYINGENPNPKPKSSINENYLSIIKKKMAKSKMAESNKTKSTQKSKRKGSSFRP